MKSFSHLVGFYKDKVSYCNIKDTREIVYQNKVLIPFLEALFDVDVVDVSTQYKNKKSDLHTREYYTRGDYTPDILLVKDWVYNNINLPARNYLAVIEVKSPYLEPLGKVSRKTLNEVAKLNELNCGVILTDVYTWRFYSKNGSYKEFVLYDGNRWCDLVCWREFLSYLKGFVLS